MNRPIFMFRPNLEMRIAAGHGRSCRPCRKVRKSTFLVQAILESERTNVLEITLRRVLREELKAVPSRLAVQQEETIPEQMMGFLGSLMGEEYPPDIAFIACDVCCPSLRLKGCWFW